MPLNKERNQTSGYFSLRCLRQGYNFLHILSWVDTTFYIFKKFVTKFIFIPGEIGHKQR